MFESHKWKYFRKNKKIKKHKLQLCVNYIRICSKCGKKEKIQLHTLD